MGFLTLSSVKDTGSREVRKPTLVPSTLRLLLFHLLFVSLHILFTGWHGDSSRQVRHCKGGVAPLPSPDFSPAVPLRLGRHVSHGELCLLRGVVTVMRYEAQCCVRF